MKLCDVQFVQIENNYDEVFEYIASPRNLEIWTNAFKNVDAVAKTADLETPEGKVGIKLEVKASKEFGVIDWYMFFPDGSLGTAHSRVVKVNEQVTAYSFTLLPPPVALEQLEGALTSQMSILAKELAKLKNLLDTPKMKSAPSQFFKKGVDANADPDNKQLDVPINRP